jgi:hypothetical protein
MQCNSYAVAGELLPYSSVVVDAYEYTSAVVLSGQMNEPVVLIAISLPEEMLPTVVATGNKHPASTTKTIPQTRHPESAPAPADEFI